MKKIILAVIVVSIFPLLSNAQYDSIVNSFQKEFIRFKNAAIDKHTDFINHNDSVFINFLKESWKSVEVVKSKSDIKPKPVNQPVIDTDTLVLELEFINPEWDKSHPESRDNDSETNMLSPRNFDSRMVINSFDFYGGKEMFYNFPLEKTEIGKVNEEEIVNFYISLAEKEDLWESNMNLLNNARKEYRLNDWGYYQLVKSASESIFEKSNEQRLLTWYLLLKSGYRVKVGYDNNDIYLLIPSYQTVYNVLYLEEQQQTYYILDNNREEIENLKTYRASYPGSDMLFSFYLTHLPSFKVATEYRTLNYNGAELKLEFNRNILDFLSSYPHCELGAYFHSSIAENNLITLDGFFKPLLQDKTDRQKIDELLGFCQKALEYETDQDQFGRERYLFAEDSLFYPFSDCEDRSILLASLIKRYTGLASVALDFPGHVALAVQFAEDESGTFIKYNGKKYLVCDPTYINAKSGMLPPDLREIEAKIIAY